MNSPAKEYYDKKIYLQFSDLPSINLVSVRLKMTANWLQRTSEATRRRFFTLNEDWNLSFDKISYLPELNGNIHIPKSVNGKSIMFDGASVPFPWLISLLTIGILRPLGMMLIASIVHDFMFKFGYLMVQADGSSEIKHIKVERHIADRLFKDIIATVNRNSIVAWIAWYAVRLGWGFGVKYNGGRYNGRCPVLVILSFILVGGLVAIIGFTNKPLLYEVITYLVFSYFIFYLLTIITLQTTNSRKDSA